MFDRNLVQQILEDHHLPRWLAKFMAEDRSSELADTMDELFGLHPSSWLLVRQTAETIFHLANLGKVILIGRAANVITSLDRMLHVRLVGSLERRIERIRQADKLGSQAGLEFIRREDKGRARYLRKYFGRDIEDPLGYHLVLNTDLISIETAAHLIANAARAIK